MRNIHATSLSTAWVKNVYSLCVEGMVNSAQSYTLCLLSTINYLRARVQPTSFTHTMDSFTPALYTANFPYFNLLSTHLYTLSTAPTIKKKKENKKGI